MKSGIVARRHVEHFDIGERKVFKLMLVEEHSTKDMSDQPMQPRFARQPDTDDAVLQ